MDAWLVHGVEKLHPVIDQVEGPREEIQPELPRVSTSDPALISAASGLIDDFRNLFEAVSKAPSKERVISHLIETGMHLQSPKQLGVCLLSC